MAAKDQNIFRMKDFRVNSFDSGVDGVDPITPSGTHVPKSKETAVTEAAKRAGVEIVKSDEDEAPAQASGQGGQGGQAPGE